MKIDVLTLFPGVFDILASHSILKRAIERGLVSLKAHDLRAYTHDKHRTCDDRPFGGGPGMLLKPEPIFEAVEGLCGKRPKKKGRRFIVLTPSGRKLDQKLAEELSRAKELVLLCGHYEGVDQRVVDRFATDEISIGDYVLTGGELPAMVLIDTVARLVPGVLGSEGSKAFESFTGNLLEYPQYTRPAVYRGLKVPAVLLSGNHQEIESWRKAQATKITSKRRPDLLRESPVPAPRKSRPKKVTKGEGHAPHH